MSIGIIITVILIGIFLILVDVFLIPGTFIPGLFGLAMMTFGIYMAFLNYGSLVGSLSLGGSFLATSVIAVLGYKSLKKSKFIERSVVEGKVNVIDGDLFKVGDLGETIAVLRPNGKILINGKRMEAYSKGPYIEVGVKVVIYKIAEGKIYVKPYE